MMLRRRLANLARREDGVIAPLVAICMVLLLGFTALVVDWGLLYTHRTQIQKAVDAAALAGAQDLMPGSTTSADSDATTYAGLNGVKSGEILSGSTGKLTVYDGPCAANGCPAYRVSAQRSVPLLFAPILGSSSGNVGATATAINSPAKSIESEYLMPYAIWDGNGGSLSRGQVKTYRDNSWPSDNVVPDPDNCKPRDSTDPTDTRPLCNANWNVPGNDTSFKGFLHMPDDKCSSTGGTNRYSQGDSFDQSKGGNSDENACKTILNSLASSDQAALMPVIDYACKNGGCAGGPISSCPSGDICVHIKGFIGVIPSSVGSMGQAWNGTLTNWETFHGTPGGPSTSEPAVYILKLWY